MPTFVYIDDLHYSYKQRRVVTSVWRSTSINSITRCHSFGRGRAVWPATPSTARHV